MRTIFILVIALLSGYTAAKPPPPGMALQSIDLLAEGSFTNGIEGPACDKEGNLYAVNFARQGTIGVVNLKDRSDKGSVFIDLRVELGDSATANGIRYRQGSLYVVDYVGHRLLKIDVKTKQIKVLAQSDKMNQPNDLAMAAGGVYMSDPNWKAGTGRVWYYDFATEQLSIACDSMGTTNGIEVSTDGAWLYVGLSAERQIVRFLIDRSNGKISNQQQVISFADGGLDGMRCDERGYLYATRYDKGEVAVLYPSPRAKILYSVSLTGRKPSNLTFYGTSVYITMADRGCFETFEARFSGRE